MRVVKIGSLTVAGEDPSLKLAVNILRYLGMDTEENIESVTRFIEPVLREALDEPVTFSCGKVFSRMDVGMLNFCCCPDCHVKAVFRRN